MHQFSVGDTSSPKKTNMPVPVLNQVVFSQEMFDKLMARLAIGKAEEPKQEVVRVKYPEYDGRDERPEEWVEECEREEGG